MPGCLGIKYSMRTKHIFITIVKEPDVYNVLGNSQVQYNKVWAPSPILEGKTPSLFSSVYKTYLGRLLIGSTDVQLHTDNARFLLNG